MSPFRLINRSKNLANFILANNSLLKKKCLDLIVNLLTHPLKKGCKYTLPALEFDFYQTFT